MKDISGDGDELLKFPVAYPIKVVGRRSDTLRAYPSDDLACIAHGDTVLGVGE